MHAGDPEQHLDEVLRGGGEMGALMRSIDWAATPLGPVHTWPQSLRTALSILLETGFPMYIAWGPEFIQFYNDGYRPILGSTKHPAAMGASTRETFAEIWDIIGPMFAGVMNGTPTTFVDFMLPLDRHGFVEECYFIYSYSPIRQESGDVGGVLVTVTETTTRVIGERRLKTTQALAARTRAARAVSDACRIVADVLVESAADMPFAVLYLVDLDQRAAHLEALSNVEGPSLLAPTTVPLVDIADAGIWRFGDLVASRRPHRVDVPEMWRGATNGARAAEVLPIAQQGSDQLVGILVAGLSPRLMPDAGYLDFLTLVASQIGTAIASARALEEAQARAEALAALDRAKTAFFSNVSHEFRTPLTLLLGPTEQAMAEQRPLTGTELAAVHRNGQRLLKLVNTLLDFSRIEAGRTEAVFEPTDLAALTADLASAFRSAMERAGLRLEVDCPALPEPVYVDREMWEKIVLNLLSNAFKFTFAGSIGVSLAWHGDHVDLTVTDTGVGIAGEHLAHVFDRFSRVERSRARTHEGSGIGLALVRELVTMHGGTIAVESVVDRGAAFTVSLPTGRAHLDPARVGIERASAPTAIGAEAYVQEALRWLPSADDVSGREGERLPLDQARVLVADDNADMRDYIARILRERWSVEIVGDGLAALAAAFRERPDVVVSDVMMPALDGFQLLRALRGDERTRSVPVILLSARAGQEAEISGLESGADDYLVKPFSARELVARVQTQVFRSKVRSVEEMHAVRLASIFEHAPVGVAILNGPAHAFEFANRVYLEMIGRRAVVGLPIREALPELDGQGLCELLDEVYASGEPHLGRSVRVRLDRGGPEPEETFFDFVYQPLFEQGRVSGIAVVCFEVTELERARERAEAANRAKDEFLAMLGHELRNPLAPILTALQLMQLRGVTGAERERAVIERQVKHVVGLVDDLLDVSRITRGKVHLERKRLDIVDVVAKAIEMTSPAIDERRHRLVVDVPRGLMTSGDSARLAQVFANLLMNAAKYSDPGGTIAIAARPAEAGVVVTVKDTGHGIDRELMPKLFEPFVQGRQAFERAQGGLGLGLAIVRNLVGRHGGTIDVESQKGLGSMFTVTLPPYVGGDSVPEQADAASAPPGVGVPILIVDDNEDAAGLLADSLRTLGHTVQVVHDGPSALGILHAFRPQVALLDLGLPVMDGFELAQRIRGEPLFQRIELVAITGYGQEIDRQRTAENGFGAHLVKPVDVIALDALIRERVRTASDAADRDVNRRYS